MTGANFGTSISDLQISLGNIVVQSSWISYDTLTYITPHGVGANISIFVTIDGLTGTNESVLFSLGRAGTVQNSETTV